MPSPGLSALRAFTTFNPQKTPTRDITAFIVKSMLQPGRGDATRAWEHSASPTQTVSQQPFPDLCAPTREVPRPGGVHSQGAQDGSMEANPLWTAFFSQQRPRPSWCQSPPAASLPVALTPCRGSGRLCKVYHRRPLLALFSPSSFLRAQGTAGRTVGGLQACPKRVGRRPGPARRVN